MTAIPAHTGRFVWTDPAGGVGEFRPHGRMVQVGRVGDLDVRHLSAQNPERWAKSGPQVQAARIIVGFNVDDVPTWSMDSVIPIVRDARIRQIGDPGATFVAQKGLYKKARQGRIIEEDGAQIIIVDIWDTPRAEFRRQMVELADLLIAELQQDEVLVEMQRDGITQEVIGVGR